MADVFTSRKRSEVMSKIRSKDTAPELAIRRALHRRGLRYVLHDKRYPGRPDIVFPRQRVAVQVRGCFWHGHSCIDGHQPKSRRGYWGPKLLGNKRRDRRNDRALRALGWKVLSVWDCDCQRKQELPKVLNRILRQLGVAPKAMRHS